MPYNQHERERIEHAAGHLVASERDGALDPHAGDSAELAWEIFEEVFAARVLRCLGAREVPAPK